MAADESGKVDVKDLLSKILTKIDALDKKIDTEVEALNKKIDAEVEARRDLSEKATETLTDYSAAIEGLQQSQFAMLSMHIDIVGPRRKHPDPEVAEEATTHAKLAMEAQAVAAPTLFENLYGISAETGEELPGREAGVALDRV